jgi:hypothetical protein
MIYSKVLTMLQQELKLKYEISSTIFHRGEKGRKRESSLADFLREYLPDAYGVGTGEIITFDEDLTSPQCDIIIYDRLYTPIIGKSGPIQQIPNEGIYSIVEVKSNLTKTALTESLEKFRRICGEFYNKENANSPKFFVFGYQRKMSIDECCDYLREYRDIDTSIVAIDSGFTFWPDEEVGVEADEPRIVWVLEEESEEGPYLALAFFFVSILDACQSARNILNYRRILLPRKKANNGST